MQRMATRSHANKQAKSKNSPATLTLKMDMVGKKNAKLSQTRKLESETHIERDTGVTGNTARSKTDRVVKRQSISI